MLEDAQKDYLTGFYLREALNSFLMDVIRDAKLNKRIFTIAVIDLDHFKRFNDKFGHDFGDEILKYIASTLRLTLEEECQIFRYGGDEFIAGFIGKDPREVFKLMRTCVYNISVRPFLYKNKFYKITFSCGISSFPSDAEGIEELIKKADTAMYFSKRHGHNLVTHVARITYITWRNIFAVIISVCLVVTSLFALHHYLKGFMSYALKQIKKLRVIPKPKDLDTIILKSGVVHEGYIFEELDDRVIFSLYLEKGEGMVVFNKDEIEKIKYGSRRHRSGGTRK